MANILGRYGHNREQSYFKQEEEADIQAFRKRLVKEGKLTADGGWAAGAERPKVFDADGDEVSPVLMEVLQARARIAPEAARNRIWELRKRAGLPPLSEEELEKAIRQLRLGQLPLSAIVPTKMSLSTAHSMRALESAARAPPRYRSRAHYEPTPEQQALARRTFMLSLRVAAYGSGAGILGVLALGTATAHYYDIRSFGDVRQGLKAWAGTLRDPLRTAVAPVKTWLTAWVPKSASRASCEDPSSAQEHQPSEFSRRMRARHSGR